MFGKQQPLASIIFKYQALLLLLILIAVFSALSPYFLTLSNLQNIVTASAVIGIIALGASFVIAAGAIDLSAGSVMALCAVVTAIASQHDTASPIVALVIASSCGAACGLVTALLINATGAPSFIVSLGMLSMARALAYIVSDATPVYGLAEAVTVLGQERFWGIAGPVYFFVLCAGVAQLLLHYTRFGVHTTLFGDSAEVATAMGISSNALRIKIFLVAGVCAGVAGFVLMARTNSGDPAAGQNYELLAITAVILGGANLFGGRASILGTVAGVLCLGTLQNGLNLLAVSTYFQVLFVGLVLIMAAFLSRIGRSTS